MALRPQLVNLTRDNLMDVIRSQRGAMPQSTFFPNPFSNIHRPSQEILSRRHPNFCSMRNEGFRIELKLSMCNYKPEDVKVEVVDNFIVLEAKHEERKEKRCFVTRGFKRRLCLPMFTNAEDVHAKWSCGWLSIYIPIKNGYNFPVFESYSTTGGEQPIKRNAKPVIPKKVRAVPIRVVD